jgi:LacI family transcriptional regulator
MLWEKYNVNKEKTAIANYIKKVPKPIAVFCSNDLRAHQLISVCHELKIKVPEEVSILGVDNDEMLCAFSSPSISSINPNGHGIGYKAAQTLSAMMDGEKVNPVISIQPSQLVSRSSSEVFSLDALPSWMSDALVFINANISKCLSASDVYNHVKRSHTIIDNAFREKLNTSVSKEIQLSRLREAHRLVTTTKLPFSTVSKLSGFASVQYFTRSFTAAYGKSPTALREKYI